MNLDLGLLTFLCFWGAGNTFYWQVPLLAPYSMLLSFHVIDSAAAASAFAMLIPEWSTLPAAALLAELPPGTLFHDDDGW